LEREKLETIQERGYQDWYETKLYVVDARDSQKYEQEHIKGSGKTTAKRLTTLLLPSDTTFVLISDSQDLVGLRKTLEEVERNSLKNGLDRKAKIYLLKDGYEGLKRVGLKTEAGGYD
jgi:hypothetical protein